MDFLCNEPDSFIDPSVIAEKLLRKRGITREEMGLRKTVIFSFIEDMKKLLLNKLDVKEETDKIFRTPFYNSLDGDSPFSVIGDPVGAPQAVILMEQLIGFGVENILFLGLCGGLQEHTHIGDVVIPTHAHREEGTSFHYLPPGVMPHASGELVSAVENSAAQTDLTIHKGPLWTTDAIYRETRAKINKFRQMGALGVDMETSAVYSVAQYRGIEAAAVLVVSDETTGPEWKPGFSSPRFLETIGAACDLILEAARSVANEMATPDGQ